MTNQLLVAEPVNHKRNERSGLPLGCPILAAKSGTPEENPIDNGLVIVAHLRIPEVLDRTLTGESALHPGRR